MAGIDIDAESLDAAGQGIESTAERFGETQERFQSTIEGFADAFGADEIGSLIGDAHQTIFDWVMECCGEAQQSIADAGFDVRDFAVQHQDADDQAAQAFQQLAGNLGGNA